MKKTIIGLGAAILLGLPQTAGADTSQGWLNVEHTDMAVMKRDVFHVYTKDRASFKMRLVRVDISELGDDAPDHLLRKNGFSAVFVAPPALMEALFLDGQQTVSIYHPELGQAEIYIGAFQRQDGQYFIEAIFG